MSCLFSRISRRYSAVVWIQTTAGSSGSDRFPGRRWPPASYHATLKPARLVLGALIIKYQLKLSGTETLEQLRENPYLQFFCGLKRYQRERL